MKVRYMVEAREPMPGGGWRRRALFVVARNKKDAAATLAAVRPDAYALGEFVEVGAF